MTFAAGLISHQAKLCISSLAICTLEMQPTMIRQVATILQRLSQVSASVAMAVPVLEFLHGVWEGPSFESYSPLWLLVLVCSGCMQGCAVSPSCARALQRSSTWLCLASCCRTLTPQSECVV